MQRARGALPLPQDPPERVPAAARRQRLAFPSPRGEGRRMYPPAPGPGPQGPVPGLQAVRRLLQEHADGDGEEGRDPDPLGYRHRRVRRRERGAGQYSRRLPGK